MTADELNAHMSKLSGLRNEMEQLTKDTSVWAFNAKNTRQHRDAIGLMFRGRELANELMSELLKASIQASELRLLMGEVDSNQAAGNPH